MIKINKEVLFYCIFTEKRNIFCHVNKQGCYKKKEHLMTNTMFSMKQWGKRAGGSIIKQEDTFINRDLYIWASPVALW